MPKNITYILYLILVLPFIAGCSEGLYIDDAVNDSQEELPIEFDFQLPDTQGTRGFDGQVKTAFENDDVIHILATFKTQELQSDGEYKSGQMTRYGALQLKDRNWEEVSGNELRWPSVAVNGTFTAYYISESDGLLTGVTESQPYKLADIVPEKGDPLCAQSDDDIDYGRAVPLKFNHLCAYLTLRDLEPQVSTTYWFKSDDANFNNAYRLSLDKDGENNPVLKFEFCKVPDREFDNLVYIAANAEPDGVGENAGSIVKANYFLEPGDYTKFSLCYPATKPKVYDYVKYDYNKIILNNEETGEEAKPDLDAGKTYTLTITKSPGVTIVSPPSGDGWDESETYFDVDVEKFLKAIKGKTFYDYTDGTTTTRILETTADGVKLLHNVDFHGFSYSSFEDSEFVPNIEEGTVFDGDYHYIRNLASPLFRYNYGTIKNVGIRTIKIDKAISEDMEHYGNPNTDMSRHGALCMWNRQNATISNVRVIDVDMTVYVKSKIRASQADHIEVHNIGCVIGSNTGKVSEMALQGPLKLHVAGLAEEDYKTNVNAQVLIGGIVGQNAIEGNIYDVSPLESGLVIEITNECVGDFGSYSVGGVVGQSSGTITGAVLSDVKIDGTNSAGVTSYMGGIAGQLSATTNAASIESCIVSGSVVAGTTKKYSNLTSESCIGGIAGTDFDVSVLDCRTVVSVQGSTTVSDGVTYATGGAFGQIGSTTTVVKNMIVYGSDLNGPNRDGTYIGNFAGIVPTGQTWGDYEKNNILIRTFGYNNIGGTFDSAK